MTAPGPDWVEQARRFAAGLAAEHVGGAGLTDVLGGLLGGPAPRPGPDATADHGTDCRWCPLCAGLAALRGRRPDLVEALADVLAGAAAALRATASSTPDGGGSDVGADAGAPATEPTVPPEEPVPHPARTPTVQRIDVA
jgi:hypothetical protein